MGTASSAVAATADHLQLETARKKKKEEKKKTRKGF
jgi:hypothetical protein